MLQKWVFCTGANLIINTLFKKLLRNMSFYPAKGPFGCGKIMSSEQSNTVCPVHLTRNNEGNQHFLKKTINTSAKYQLVHRVRLSYRYFHGRTIEKRKKVWLISAIVRLLVQTSPLYCKCLHVRTNVWQMCFRIRIGCNFCLPLLHQWLSSPYTYVSSLEILMQVGGFCLFLLLVQNRPNLSVGTDLRNGLADHILHVGRVRTKRSVHMTKTPRGRWHNQFHFCCTCMKLLIYIKTDSLINWKNACTRVTRNQF